MGKPIIFSAPDVQSILEGRKTQTRRVVKPQLFGDLHPYCLPGSLKGCWSFTIHKGDSSGVDWEEESILCPYGCVGFNLWVRETWLKEDNGIYRYKADLIDKEQDSIRKQYGYKWKSPIHMPRKASRINLEITDIKIQLLQDITEEDAIAEGAMFTDFGENKPGWHFTPAKSSDECLISARYAFGHLWESIHGVNSWTNNLWVWAIEFKLG